MDGGPGGERAARSLSRQAGQRARAAADGGGAVAYICGVGGCDGQEGGGGGQAGAASAAEQQGDARVARKGGAWVRGGCECGPVCSSRVWLLLLQRVVFRVL